MGKEDIINPHKPFTHDNVLDKQLVIQMLKFETEYTISKQGQSLYENPLNLPLQTLNVEKTLNRITLNQFGFDTSDESVETYRTIFGTYYRSPTDYDKEVLDSSHYMRENKVVYYTSPKINIGDILPNCRLFQLNGTDDITLYDTLNKKANYTVVAAFSLS